MLTATLHRQSVLALTLCLLAGVTLAEKTPRATTSPTLPKNWLADATWEYSTDGGKTFSTTPPQAPRTPTKTLVEVLARTTFTSKTPSPPVCLQLENALIDGWIAPQYRLNKAPVFGPLPKVRYRTIPAIPTIYLAKKPPHKNTLTAAYTLTAGKNAKIKPALFGMTPKQLRFDVTPVLGAFGPEHLMLTVRTNLPATVTLRAGGRADTQGKNVTFLQWKRGAKLESPKGLFHRFFIRKPKTINALRYQLTATCQNHDVRFPATGFQQVLLPRKKAGESKDNPLRFVIAGDSRSNPKVWTRVAKSILDNKPSFMVLLGDYIGNGLYDHEWIEQFTQPAQALLASTPSFPVIGNHEENSPLYFKIFTLPKGDKPRRPRDANFSHVVGPVHLIGIDGEGDFSPTSPRLKWLEEKLAASTSKFTFLISHYPAFSSSSHGGVDAKGIPKERPSRQAREHILPLLRKYNASAYFAGHDHVYERSTLPGGLVQIIAGGGGAPLRPKSKTAKQQNPYSSVFASVHHYVLADVADETCTLRVVTPEGKQIDTIVLQARK